MASDPKLEATIDKILNQTESELLASLKKSFDESSDTLSKSQNSLEQEYERIINEGTKEAEKLDKQIIGSSDLESRNKQLLLVEESIEKVFEKALEKIKTSNRDQNFSKLLDSLINEATEA